MRRIGMAAVMLILLGSARAQSGGILGAWRSPTGATISIYHCGNGACAKIVALGKNTPTRVDEKNPDASLRKRALCGLGIGSGFHLVDNTHADGGQLYDPKSGKTYSGEMASDGDSLKLRGYIGLRMFGRTEMWTRVRGDVPACQP